MDVSPKYDDPTRMSLKALTVIMGAVVFLSIAYLLGSGRLQVTVDGGRDLLSFSLRRQIAWGLPLVEPGEPIPSSEFTAGYELVISVVEFQLDVRE